MNDWAVIVVAVTFGVMIALVGYVLDAAVSAEHRRSMVVRIASWLLVTIGLGMVNFALVLLLIAALLHLGVIA